MPIAERPVPKSELDGVREAFLTNSNVGIVPVTRIDDYLFPIGEETRRLSLRLRPESPFQPKPLSAAMA